MSEIEKEKQQKLTGNSLFFLGEENFIRKFCATIVFSTTFGRIIIILIIVSSITLALESPLYDPKGDLMVTLNYIDSFTTGSFLIEALLKIITFGFCFNG